MAFDFLDGLVPGDNYHQLVTQFFGLLQVVFVAGVEEVKSSKRHDGFGVVSGVVSVLHRNLA